MRGRGGARARAARRARLRRLRRAAVGQRHGLRVGLARGEIGQLRTQAFGVDMRIEEIASAGGVAKRYGTSHAIDVLKALEAGDDRAKRV